MSAPGGPLSPLPSVPRLTKASGGTFRRTELLSYSAIAVQFRQSKDLRNLALVERKRQLRKLLGRRRSRILYLDHIENDGQLLFEQIVRMDLEGMVCKRRVATE